MARTKRQVRRLTADELGIDSTPLEPARSGGVDKRIPDQIDAPILTEIDDNRLIRKPGRPIERTAPIAGMSQYLAEQYHAVASDLEAANTDKRTVSFFREAEALLQDWSITTLLSFGAHLYLLESSVGPLRHELSDPLAQRVDAVVRNSRMFINSFEEWHAYVRQSVVLDIEIGGHTTDIVAATEAGAETLAESHDSVDPEIPHSLREFAATASRKGSEQSVAVGIMSALRSFTNISISFVGYIISNAKNLGSIFKDDRALNLFRTICRFFPFARQLVAVHPDYAWLLNHADDIAAVCDQLKTKG